MQRILLLLLVVAACAGPRVALRPADPLRSSDDIDRASFTFTGAGGVELYAQSWRPRGAVRGTLIVHHGLADHGARYGTLAEQLTRAGYAVYAFDVRGHARSSGIRVRVDAIDELLGDLDAFVARVRAREPDAPLFLFGHSLGGLVTALYAIEKQPPVAGVILSAPGLAFDFPPIQPGAIRFIAALAPNAPILATPFEDFSSSADVVADMHRDPLIFQSSGPARTARAAADGLARVWARPERLVAPLLALHGTGDRIVSPIGSRDLVARAGGIDRTFRTYDGFAHDLLHEPGGQSVADDIRAWLDAHTGGPAASFPAPAQLADKRAPAIAIELGARGEHASGVDGGYGELRVRFGIARPVGYAAGLDLRGGYLDGARFEADAHLLGLALRATSGASLALTGGIGIGDVRGIGTIHLPVELALELPVGPVHVFARGGLRIPDDANATLGVRLGADRRYWSTVVSGAGPYIGVSYRNFDGVALYGIVLGGQLWGAL